MFGRFFSWRGRQRPFICNDIEARLEAYEDGRLPTTEQAAFAAHLDSCARCRRLVKTGPAWLYDLREEPARARLTLVERRAMQQALAKRMRRKTMMRDFRLSLQNVVAMAALLLIVGGVIWWQTAVSPEPASDPVATKPPTPQPAAEGDATTITLAVESGSQSRYQPLIDAFEQEHPGIQVRLVSVSEVANPDDGGIRALASSFDVFPYSPNRQGETQYLLDLRPFLTLDPDFDAADFYPGLLPAASEPLYAMPTGAAYYLIYYDKTAFDAAERPYPALAWTTDDFLETAVALTTREGDTVTRWGYVPAQMRYMPLLAAQLNAPLQTADGLRLQDPDVATALAWVSDLFTEYEVAPWLDEYRPAARRSGGDPSPTALIADGRAALWHTTHLLYDANESNVGVTAVPQGDYGLAAEPLIFGFAASRGTANPEAAWALLAFLSRQPPQDSAFQISLAPARRSVAAATNFWAQLPPELAPALQYSADNSAAPRIPAQAVDPLMTAFAAQIDDGVDTAVALGQLPPSEAAPADAEVEPIAVPTAPAAANDSNVVEITFYTPVGMEEVLRPLARQFQESHPDIRIRFMVEEIVFGVEQDSLFNRAAGSDCTVGWNYDLTDDNLLPLSPLLDIDTTMQPESFYPALLQKLTVDGELLGLPLGVSIPYLEYNRGLFQEAGVPEPTLGWTVDDFLQAALQLSSGEGEAKQYAYALPGRFFDVQSAANDFGVQLVDYSEPVPNFDYAAATEMLTWYTDLIRTHEVQPLMAEDFVASFQQFDALFLEERIAMWSGMSYNFYKRYFPEKPVPTIDLGIAPQPVGSNGVSQPPSYVQAYFIFADSPHAAACWEWIRFLVTEPSAAYRPEQAYQMLPGHIETAESQAYADIVGEQIAAIGLAYINNLPPTTHPFAPEWMEPGYDWLREAYFAVAAGESEVAAALAVADEKFSQYRQCVIEQDAFEDEAAQQACEDAVR